MRASDLAKILYIVILFLLNNATDSKQFDASHKETEEITQIQGPKSPSRCTSYGTFWNIRNDINSNQQTSGNCQRLGKRTVFSGRNLSLSDALECLNSVPTSTHLEIIASVAIYIDIDIDSKSLHSVRNRVMLVLIAHTWVVMNGIRTFSLDGADGEGYGLKGLSGKNGVSFVGILAEVHGTKLVISSLGGNGGNGEAKPRVFRGMYCKDPKFMVEDQVHFPGKGLKLARCCKQDAYFWYDGGSYAQGGHAGKGGQIRIYTATPNLETHIVTKTGPGSNGKDGTPTQGAYTKEFPSKEELQHKGVVKIGKRYFIICAYGINYRIKNETFKQEGKMIPSKPRRSLEFSELDLLSSWLHYKRILQEESTIAIRSSYLQWIQNIENSTTIGTLIDTKNHKSSNSRLTQASDQNDQANNASNPGSSNILTPFVASSERTDNFIANKFEENSVNDFHDILKLETSHGEALLLLERQSLQEIYTNACSYNDLGCTTAGPKVLAVHSEMKAGRHQVTVSEEVN